MRKYSIAARFRTLLIILATLGCCSTVTHAQFRDLGRNEPEAKAVDLDELIQTRHRFVPPTVANSTKTVVAEGIRAVAPAPIRADEIPAADAIVVRKGAPTPAVRQDARVLERVTVSSNVPKATSNARPTVAVPEVVVKKLAADGQPISGLTTSAPTVVQDTETTSPTVAQYLPIPVHEPTNVATVETGAARVAGDSVANASVEPMSMFAIGESQNPKNNPLVFNQIAIGTHTAADVRRLWGEPAKVVEVDGIEKMIYAAPGFRQVDVLTNGTGPDDSKLAVESILVHLTESQKLNDAIQVLSLQDLKPVEVKASDGQPVGVGFPERGVMLTYDDSPKTTRTIAVEAVRGELFRLRAQANKTQDFTAALADLESAIELDDFDSRAHWLKSELLSKLGRTEEAFAAVATAIERSPDPLYKLTQARLNAARGESLKSIRETNAVIRDESLPTVVRARAKYQLGNLLATGPDSDFEKSLAAHLGSIELAATAMNDEDVETRRMAKTLLVDAHLAIAQDIALGNYQRQLEVVPKWLIRGTELAEKFIQSDGGDEMLRLDIFRASLAAYSVLSGQFDASVAADDAIQEGESLISKSNDPIFHRYVEDQLVEILFYAAQVEHLRGRSENAMKFAKGATELVAGRTEQETSTFQSYVAGQLYFLIGSIHAIEQHDHKLAVEWYDKATPILNNHSLEAVADRTQFADLFVSMAVTYWEVGEKEKALELTESGVQLMQDAVQSGKVTLDSLEVPYSNLASMHQQLGNDENAKHYTEMMAKVGKGTTGLRR